MRRYLVVANQTLGGEHLAEAIRTRLARGPSNFHVVVPATQRQDQAVWTEGEARALATKRLEAAVARFRGLGADVEGEVGDERPLEAIADAVREREFDEIILSTLPPGLSRWLRQDLPHRVERQFDLPVQHVVGDPEPAESTGSTPG
ncbi:MAG TPA: universal stress protein [Actinomycetota bacterium]|nr:universal stress protein [Actinomycetota bacterium]